jgi:urea transport system permease protein
VGLILALAVPTAFFAFFGAMMFQARIAGVFIAIMTLAMLAAWYAMAYDMQPFTAGFNGISPPMPLQIFGTMIDPYSATAYWICVGFLAGLTMLAKLLMQSRFGTVVQAIRDDPERARFLGYNVALYQTVLFSISGFIAAVAGLCWVLVVQYVSPTALELSLSLSAVVWAAVGGRLSLLGAIIGAFMVNSAQSYLGDELQDIWVIFLGTIFIVIVLLLPTGIIGLVENVLGRLTGKLPDDIEPEASAKGRV